jgi:hypothetical protein
MGSTTGELRLYAIGIDEFCGIVGADPEHLEELRAAARTAFTITTPEPARTGLIGKLGPIFRRPPATPVISPTQPEPSDVETLLAGAYVPHDRMGATWRVLEVLAQARAWGSTRMTLSTQALDDLDFALARGGVSAAVGLRHLLNTGTGVRLLPVQGLTVGWHRYEQALAMASAYRTAIGGIKSTEQQEMIAALVTWLDGCVPWAHLAPTMRRPAPDLVGFWAA